MMILKKITHKIRLLYATSSSERLIEYLREGGVKIGERCVFRDPHSVRIDMTRPCLVTIGDDVDINVNFTILTHDWCSHVFRNLYHDFLNSSGRVNIGNNVYIATDVTILKGVNIGDNCIIGAGSIVNRSIPSGSVAVGVPCRVVCSVEDYYKKRKFQTLEEAKDYVRAFRERHGREPRPEEMWEEFIWFVDQSNIDSYPEIPIRQQLGAGYENWLRNHKAQYEGLEKFLESLGKSK